MRRDLDEWIAAYLKGAGLREAPRESWLFRAGQRRGSPLTDRVMLPLAVQLVLKRRLKAAGLPEILSPHSFRVPVVTDLHSQNVPLEDVQYLAGHSHPRTAQIYDRRRLRVSRNLVERISACPLERLATPPSSHSPEDIMITDRRPVRVKAFCVGQAKSGTASLVGLLSANYRVAHEPERPETLKVILREAQGRLSMGAIRAYLCDRDARLDIEYDVAWANQFIIDHLLAIFPSARFIVLIRDCHTWLQSIMGHLVGRNIPLDVLEFLRWWFKPELYPHGPHDRALADRGLFSIAAYLHAWNWHVDTCTGLIPADRRLVLRTHELDSSHQRLAEFLRIPVESLDGTCGHRNRGTWSERIDSLVTPAYIDDMVHSICGVNMARYFPEFAMQ